MVTLQEKCSVGFSICSSRFANVQTAWKLHDALVWQAFRLWLCQQELWDVGKWSIDLAVTCNLTKLSDTQREKTRFETLCFPPLTGICSDTAVRSVLPLLFLRSLSSPIINICSWLQDFKLSWIGPKEYLPHTVFITANCLHICVMIKAGLLKFQSLIWMAVSYGKCLTAIQIRHTVRLFEF